VTSILEVYFAQPEWFRPLSLDLRTPDVDGAPLVVGLTRALAISFYAELEVLAIYVIVIVVLVVRPAGLFGKPVE